MPFPIESRNDWGRFEAPKLVKVKAHKRILFDGDNYTEEWRKEAEARGVDPDEIMRMLG